MRKRFDLLALTLGLMTTLWTWKLLQFSTTKGSVGRWVVVKCSWVLHWFGLDVAARSWKLCALLGASVAGLAVLILGLIAFENVDIWKAKRVQKRALKAEGGPTEEDCDLETEAELLMQYLGNRKDD